MEKTRLNWSTLKHLHVSAKLLAWRVEHPKEDTPDLRLGRAIHCAVLEPEAYPKRWIMADQCAATTGKGARCGSGGSLYNGQWFCKVKGHAPADAIAPRDFEVLEPEDAALVAICADSVRSHDVAAKMLQGGKPEERIEWLDPESGVECRGTVDYLRANDLIDLKSTRRETIRDFVGDVVRNLYFGQLAWYYDGAIAAGRLPKDAPLPFIIAVSTAEPYDVMAFQLSPQTLEGGRVLYRDLLNRYLQCRAASWWPGLAPDLLTLDLPSWAPGMQGSQEEGSW